jgi:hypothetical protein
MLTLRFSNASQDDPLEAAGQGFALETAVILRAPEGEPLARYSGGQWWIRNLRFTHIECAGPVVCRVGDRQLGPFSQIRLVDGVLLGDEVPLASMHSGQGWTAGEERWPRIVLQPG